MHFMPKKEEKKEVMIQNIPRKVKSLKDDIILSHGTKSKQFRPKVALLGYQDHP